MGLRDRILPASFRGVPFIVTRTGARGLARRAQVHEYPKRDVPYTEDLGKQAGSFEVEGFIQWDGLEALLIACALAGPGALVHPLFGVRQVVCTVCETDDGTDSAGITRLRLSFQEAGQNAFPTERPNRQARVAGAVESLRDKLRSKFAEKYQGSVAQWVTDSALGWVRDTSAFINSAAQQVPGASDLASFNVVTAAIGASTPGVFSDPNALGLSISSAITKLTDLATDPSATLRMLESFATFGSGFTAPEPTTRSRVALAQRRDALVRLVRSSAAGEASRVAAATPLDSYDAATALRGRMVALLEPQITSAGDSPGQDEDETLAALQAVLVEVVRDLRERGGELARLHRVTLGAPVPAVVLAYRLYADADRAEEIVARNRLRHPLFVPAATSLEVLSA